MQRFGREDTGVKIPGSDKYIGTLNVFHELHCIVSQVIAWGEDTG